MENTFHRYLNLPFTIEPPEIFKKEEKTAKHYILNELEYPDINSFFSKLGLRCFRKECFYTPPYGKVPIHTDHGSYTNHLKLNVSWGPEEGVIQWWKSDIVEERIIDGGVVETNARHHNLWAEEKDCEFLYEANTNIPSLVNVGVLHGTNNPTPYPRWTLCFVPVKLKSPDFIHWNEGMEIFKNYIG